MESEILVGQNLDPRVTSVRGAATYQPTDWFIDAVNGGARSDSGVRVTAESSLTYSSVWQSVCIISQTVAGLPLELYRRDSNDDRTRDRVHPAYVLLNVTPEGAARTVKTSAFAFREALQSHALLRGNGYAELFRDGSGAVVEMRLLPPDATYPELSDSGELFYWTIDTPGARPRMLLPRQVFHLKGLGTDGIQGYSVVTLARNSWGLGLGAEKHGAQHFKNNSRPNVVLKVAQSISADKASEIRRGWDHVHQGLDAKSGTAVLSGGVEAVPLAISNEDSQWLQSRKFQRQECASWFNLPPHMLGDDTRTGYNSIIEENRRFLSQTLRPWLTKWTSEADLKLLTTEQRSAKEFYFEHNVRSLIEQDTAQTAELAVKLIGAEVLSVNEARRLLNMNRRPTGGDEYRNPNINPATPAARTRAPQAKQLKRSDRAAVARLVSERVQKLRSVERSQAARAAKAPNFLDWLDQWFASFEVRIVDALRPIEDVLALIGVECSAESVARRHVDREKARLLELSGRVTLDKLQAAIEEFYDNDGEWPNTLAQEVCDNAHNQLQAGADSKPNE